MMMMTSGITFILSCMLYTQTVEATSGENLGARLQTLVDDLGVNDFQSYLDTSPDVKYVSRSMVGGDLVSMMSESLAIKFEKRILVVKQLRNTIERAYSYFTTSNPYSTCCSVHLKEYDYRFKERINQDQLCVIGQGLAKKGTKFVTSSVLETMKKNFQETPTIKRQYFGSEEGVSFRYPAGKTCSKSFDPRFRPWYVETATPVPKDVVIIIDRSGSMNDMHGTRTLLAIAQEAAITVVNTLNPNDRVGVVSFSDRPETPSGTTDIGSCFQSRLAFATPQNKKYLTSGFISYLHARGATYYADALKNSFSFFHKSEDPANDPRARDSGRGLDRGKVILFLTDGEPSERNDGIILNALRNENKKLNNKVIVMTYGFGGALGSSATTILEDMARQTHADTTAGEITAGTFTAVTDPGNLRKAMGSYYSFFSKTGRQPDVIFSVTYKDSFGLGLMTSACLPVHHETKLVGITCVDVSMGDLLEDVTYFRQGENSYAILIDKQGRTLMHPLLPEPQTIHDDPIFVHLMTLERSVEAQTVAKSMMAGESGHKEVSSKRVFPRGNTVHEGVDSRTVLSQYHWAPVEGSGFSICLVITDGDRQTSVELTHNHVDSFVYHRLDLKPYPDLCNHFNRIALKDISTVMLPARTFQQPYEYLNSEETVQDVERHSVYFTGATDETRDIKDGIRESVALTARFEDIIRMKNQSLATVWKYLGMRDGTYRTYPGHRLASDYDPTTRPWYQRAVARKGSVTLSIPYNDSAGAGFVITLSKALWEGKSSEMHDTKDVTIGVMGMDVTITHFYQLLLDSNSDCKVKTCFVMDDSGFIVVHKEFVELSGLTLPNIENVHITRKEDFIAQDLINRKVLNMEGCINVATQSNQYFYRVRYRNRISTGYYDMEEIPDTNVFLIIIHAKKSTRNCYCLAETLAVLPQCSRSKVSCQCPCSSKTTIYDHCQDNFNLSSDSYPLCTPQPPPVSLSSVVQDDSRKASKLAECQSNYNCQTYMSQSDCWKNAKCAWCRRSRSGQSLDKPYCDRQKYCYFGIERREGIKKGNDTHATESGSQTHIAGIAVGVVFVAIVVVVVTVVILKRKSNRRRGQRYQQSATVEPPTEEPPTAEPPSVEPPPPYSPAWSQPS